MTPQRSFTLSMVGALGGLGIIMLPVAHADGLPTPAAVVAAAPGTQTLLPTTEAWYIPDPTCPTGIGCVTDEIPSLPLPTLPSLPVSIDSLHVGYVAGIETNRSYLAFPLTDLGTVTAATLTVPISTASVQADTAHVAVCLTDVPVVAAAGSIVDPPSTDCSTSAPATYVAAPTPHLTADLTTLLDVHPNPAGIVLLPDADTVTQTDAWMISFDSVTTTGGKPATIDLTTGPDVVADDGSSVVDPTDDAATTPEDSGTTTTTSDGTGDSFSSGGTFVGAPVPAAQVPTVQNPSVAAPTGTSSGVTAAASTDTAVTLAYAYPGMWLLPLLALVLVPAIVRALTRDLGAKGNR